MLIGRVNSTSSSSLLPAGSCWKLAISTVLRHGLRWQNLALDHRKRKFGGVHLSNILQIHTCFLISVWFNNIFQVTSNFTGTMNELILDQLCKCFCKSFWVHTLPCALSDPPAYVPLFYPTSALKISVAALDPAGLTSSAATCAIPEGTKHSLIQSKGSCLMPSGPQFGYKQFSRMTLFQHFCVLWNIVQQGDTQRGRLRPELMQQCHPALGLWLILPFITWNLGYQSPSPLLLL